MDKKRSFPNTWIIITITVAIAAALSWIVPAGSYDYETINVNGTERRVAIEGTYHTIDKSETSPTGFLGVFAALYTGCVNAADVIFIIMLCAATFGVMVKTGAFHAAIAAVLRKVRKEQILLFLPVLMLTFGAGASFMGMTSEFYGFVPLVTGLFVALGYDPIVGFAIVVLGDSIGFMASTLNPFTVGVAQSIVGLPLYSGTLYRLICFVVFMAISIAYTMWYARRVERNPGKSVLAGIPCIHSFQAEDLEQYNLDGRAVLILLDMLITIVVLMYGLMKYGWGYKYYAAVFLVMSIVAALIQGWSANQYVAEFVDCAKSVVWSCVLAGLCKGIMVVLNDAQIIDTIIYGLSCILRGAPRAVSAQLMLLVQTLINFPVGSGSGQAVVTMPIMAPLADILGISRQLAVLAYQFGDGLTNLIYPTCSVVIWCGIGDIPYGKWLRWFMPLFGILLLAQMIMLQIGTMIGY